MLRGSARRAGRAARRTASSGVTAEHRQVDPLAAGHAAAILFVAAQGGPGLCVGLQCLSSADRLVRAERRIDVVAPVDRRLEAQQRVVVEHHWRIGAQRRAHRIAT